MYLLGVDIGTTSLKAAVYDEKGREKGSIHLEYTLNSHGDFVEFDPEEYWKMFLKAYDTLSEGIQIDALSVDTQCETLILADENGTPLCDAIVWLDNRATAEAAEIEAAFGTEKVYTVTGQPEITATWPACKLLWIKRNRPALWEKVRKIFLLEDFILFRLTGEFVTERTLQSSSLYFDIRKGAWWSEMLDYVGLAPEMLPKLCGSAENVGVYRGTAVVTGAIDQIAGAIGAGVTRKGCISEMTGTTMVIFAGSDSIPPFNPNSKVPCHYNYDDQYCLMLWTPTAGMTLKWFKNAFCESESFRDLDVLAEKIAPGCDGLTMLPHLCGSMMPKYNPAARGGFYGFSLEHTKGHFIRSVLEAVACMLKENLDYLGTYVDEIRCMGGGAASPLWCQIKADMTGKKLITLKNKETACLGSAILAGVGAGIFPDVCSATEALVEVDACFLPQSTDYKEVYDRYIYLDRLLNAPDMEAGK
ncbi:MAG: hypothetical protein E7408_07360 [Ruminococcaceae bacterium]|nr:hypothetical protein [Oscillospiraceae bacterium]